jgi:GMP synthase (glutamine-hydrolysing)
MDEVAELIRTTTVPLYGICFGHQIIAASLGGRVERASHPSKFIGQVNWDDGRSTSSLFTHQDHVVDAGEMEIIATSEHCGIVACQHPTRAIRTVQFHPEASSDLITQALNLGEMTAEEHTAYVFESEVMSVKNALLL